MGDDVVGVKCRAEVPETAFDMGGMRWGGIDFKAPSYWGNMMTLMYSI